MVVATQIHRNVGNITDFVVQDLDPHTYSQRKRLIHTKKALINRGNALPRSTGRARAVRRNGRGPESTPRRWVFA